MKSFALFGHKHCGKSTLAKQIAQMLNLPWIDTDFEIETRFAQNLKCKEIYQTYGEKFFRDLETEVVHSLDPTKKAIISLGGGTLLRKINLSYLEKKFFLIWVKAPYDILKERTKNKPPAYIDSNHLEAHFDEIYKSREAFFSSLSYPIIDTTYINKGSGLLCSKLSFNLIR